MQFINNWENKKQDSTQKKMMANLVLKYLKRSCGLTERALTVYTNTTLVPTFITHLHARQDKPALDFKMDFITTDW